MKPSKFYESFIHVALPVVMFELWHIASTFGVFKNMLNSDYDNYLVRDDDDGGEVKEE